MFFAVLIVFSLLAGPSFGLVALPISPAQSQAGAQFTAAETLLSQTGTIGQWTFREPPGYTPVTCHYPTDSTTQLQSILFPIPMILPVPGVLSQPIEGTVEIHRRLPDGSLMFVKTVGSFGGTAAVSPPFHLLAGLGHSADLGSTHVGIIEIRWKNGTSVQGSVRLLYNYYQTTLSPSGTVLSMTSGCAPQRPTVASLEASQGTVNQSIPFTINRFPFNPAVSIYFDDIIIGTVATDEFGNGAGSFVVPAAPKGIHTVKFYRFGRTATASFVVKPRIKLIPSSGLERGDHVNVSLRGFAANETVRIRWRNSSGSWIQVSQVVTSSTGSKNVNIAVPNFAVIGVNSVRGDGNQGAAAQTNAVTVVESAASSAAAKATATPTMTATLAATITQATATKTPTGPPATLSPTDTPTAEPTLTSTSTTEPTETATSTATAGQTSAPEG